MVCLTENKKLGIKRSRLPIAACIHPKIPKTRSVPSGRRLPPGVGIELDVHCTLDNRIVIIHDAITTRATGTNIDVTKVKYADLKELRLFGTDFSILTLDALLAEVAGRVPLFIEIKTGTPPKQSGPNIVKLLQNYQGDYAIISFDPLILRWFRRYAPQMIRGLLTGAWRYQDDGLRLGQRLVLYTACLLPLCRPQFIAHDADDIRNPFLRFWLRVTGLPLVLWPVLTLQQQATAKKLQANIIFENYNTDPHRGSLYSFNATGYTRANGNSQRTP